MKIRIAKFYQAISIFDGERYRSAITHLNCDKSELVGKLEMSIEPGIGLRIETDHDTTLVTFNNIASMHPVREVKAESKKKSATA